MDCCPLYSKDPRTHTHTRTNTQIVHLQQAYVSLCVAPFTASLFPLLSSFFIQICFLLRQTVGGQPFARPSKGGKHGAREKARWRAGGEGRRRQREKKDGGGGVERSREAWTKRNRPSREKKKKGKQNEMVEVNSRSAPRREHVQLFPSACRLRITFYSCGLRVNI